MMKNIFNLENFYILFVKRTGLSRVRNRVNELTNRVNIT